MKSRKKKPQAAADKEDTFFPAWFGGVNTFLEACDGPTLDRFCSDCARACSASCSGAVYAEAFKDAYESIDTPLAILKKTFEDFDYAVHPDRIDIVYRGCGCDLVTDTFIMTPRLCRCSEKSLLFNWESVFGEGNVRVEFASSILRGGDECRFRVRVRQWGHFDKPIYRKPTES